MIFTIQVFSIALGINIASTPYTDDETLQALKACALLKDNETRLGCYDSLLRVEELRKKKEEAKANFGLNERVSPLTAPVKPTEPKKPTLEAAKEMRPDNEVNKKPSMAKRVLNAFLKKDIEKSEITNLTIEMVSHTKNYKGKYIFRMKDGSQWKQTDGFKRPLKKGPFIVTISEGTFGSYIMRPEKGSWSVRVMRIK